MKIQNTLKIIEDNKQDYDNFIENAAACETYKGQFEDTILKKWVGIDELKELLKPAKLVYAGTPSKECIANWRGKELQKKLILKYLDS